MTMFGFAYDPSMQDHRRFAQRVRERRQQLGLSRIQVRDRGGPSEPTLTKIERAEINEPSPATLMKLDAGLAWAPGSSARLLSGGEPRDVEDHKSRSSATLPDVDRVAVDIATVTALVSVSTDLTELADQRPSDSDLRSIADDLGRALHPVYGTYVTQLFEANRREHGVISPVFAVFSHLLDEPNSSVDAIEFEERQYRRWLAGRTSGIDNATAERFARRLEGRQISGGEGSDDEA
ncbi:helix-turn-helix domain-containing protein [Rhodococcus fascians]|nr:helix-turn-helix domain-containing protein [Rhodococcus fascians]MBY4237818.1 helix-turn-helix domain-containing protein [Rhodococcus fascians]MBY4253431.1 helix-turn-helix domain-containing protein [Rhodococcus fascians]MBY4269068.1 helix-turn-helix domain-containing protein [Rhodococcus fascians]MBY4275123.1 helix-turn-helix domain-containing protein [Rhodococcus fascians]